MKNDFDKEIEKLIPEIKKYQYVGYAEYSNFGRGEGGYEHCILAKIELLDYALENIAVDVIDKYDYDIDRAVKNADINPKYLHIYVAFAPDNQGLLINSKKELSWNVYGEGVFQTYQEAKKNLLKNLKINTKNPMTAIIGSVLSGRWYGPTLREFKK